jgi:hypothetical protein
MQNRVRAAAGSAIVGAAATFPLQTDRDGTTDIELANEAHNPNRVRTGRARVVTPGFFEAMGIKLIAGRTFTADDRETTQRVAVVNRAFARRYFSGTDPVGSAIAFGQPPNRNKMSVIVGVIDDVRYKALSQEGEATFYLPQAQGFQMLRQSVVVALGNTQANILVPNIRDALQQFDPGMVATFTTSEAIVDETLARQELGMTMMLVFGATALALAAIGLYGVIAYAAAQRRSELATRIALGASAQQVFWLMMSAGQRLMAIGAVLGLVLAYVGGRIASNNVFAMRATDPAVLLSAVALVAVVAWFATMIPAIRASRQDPANALRD